MKRSGTYALLAISLVGAFGALWFARDTRFVALRNIPTADATVVSVDFDALRDSGLLSLLAAHGAEEEPEYVSFIHSTGFDYQKDLHSALISFAPQASYFLIRGRFEWSKLEGYAKANGGGCYEKLCHLPGSTSRRHISFFLLHQNVIAMAVAEDDFAATRLRDRNTDPPIDSPKEPVWISFPSGRLKQTPDTFPGMALFTSAVSDADRVTIGLGQNGADYAAKLEAICSSAKNAEMIISQLSKLTSVLKSRQVSKDELTSALVSGTFQRSDRKVFGYWPIRKSLLQTLAGRM